MAAHFVRGIRALFYVVEVELFLSIGWSWRIREVGRFSRNRVVLVFDPKYGWLVVAWRLIPSISGLRNGLVIGCERGKAEGALATKKAVPRGAALLHVHPPVGFKPKRLTS